MHELRRFEDTLSRAVARATTHPCPPHLAAAIKHAVYPGGKRLRPALALGAAFASGDDAPALADAAASAVELLHCASLVHDDLPCFDDAPLRRGRPSVQAAFGEPLAVLAGDALIVLAFETVAEAAAARPERLPAIVSILARYTGSPIGIASGQAWESEPRADLGTYHRLKTGALFEAAVLTGAIAGGGDPDDWAGVGARLGEAYQVADDLRDVLGDATTGGKLSGRDAALGRPNAGLRLGVESAVERMTRLARAAADAVPRTPGGDGLRTLILDTLATHADMEEAR